MSALVNNIDQSSAVLQSLGSTKGATGAARDVEDRFLKLLVTQLKNQDPLNPLDNAQVTTQLAQIDTVSGIDKLNGTLQNLMSLFSANQSMQAAGLIGRGVLASGSDLTLSRGNALAGIELAEPADQVTVRILDGSGRIIDSVALGPQKAGIVAFHWDGNTASGAAPDGNYRFAVDAVRGNAKVQADTLSFGKVESISAGNQGVTLNTDQLGAVEMSSIKQIL